jgi:hypothetical protein
LRGFDVNKSLKPKTGATTSQCYGRPPGQGNGIIEALSFSASMTPALLIRVPPEALRRQRVFAGIIAGRARHSRSAASAGVRAFPDSILVEQRPIRFIL